MSRYLDRNEGIGVVQELMVRACMSRHNKEELIREVETCGIPVVKDILRIVREEVDKVLWERTYDLLDYAAVTAVWKGVFGSSFRPLFFSIMHRLLVEVDPGVLVPYMRDPRVWRINVYAQRKRRCRKPK